MNYKFFISFLFVFLLATFNPSRIFAFEKSSNENIFETLVVKFNEEYDLLKKLDCMKNFSFSEETYLKLENKLENKFLLKEDGLLIEEGLFDSFTKEDLELFLSFLSQKYESIINIKDNLSFKDLKSYIQNIKNSLGLLESNNTELENLKKDNLKLESQILNLQKNILNLEIGLTITALACIGYGVYQYYNKADNK